jgi:hypothetical protein
LTLEKCDKPKPKSLGVYLGAFDYSISVEQANILSQRDAVILNPLERNVVAALAQLPDNVRKSQSIVGRLEIGEILHVPSESQKHLDEFLISGIDQLMTIILTRFQDQEGRSNGFTGVLLAGWEAIASKVLHAVCDALSTFDLEVFLETSAPNFLHDPNIMNCGAISGLVVRNALILENGERRDCFEMENLRLTVKAFVSQSCLRDFTVLIWDTMRNDVIPSNAVLKRMFSWCSFYSAVPWIGPHNALYDASVDVVPFEPLSAFDWLKEPRIMELHDLWKNKRAVSN